MSLICKHWIGGDFCLAVKMQCDCLGRKEQCNYPPNYKPEEYNAERDTADLFLSGNYGRFLGKVVSYGAKLI